MKCVIDRKNQEMRIYYSDPTSDVMNQQIIMPITTRVNQQNIVDQNNQVKANPFREAENNYSAKANEACDNRTATRYPLGKYQITGIEKNIFAEIEEIDIGGGQTVESTKKEEYGDFWLKTDANEGRDVIHVTPYGNTYGCIGLTGKDREKNMDKLIELYKQNELVDPGSSYVLSLDTKSQESEPNPESNDFD